MKKIVSIFAAALLAAGFMGCSNDSDDNSALLLALSSKNSSSASLPASVGENELAGKKFKMAFSDYSMAYEFTDSTFKYVFEAEFSSDTYNSAYTLLQESTCSYSYNATTKRLYYRKTGYNSYVGRGDKKTALFDSSYSTDAQFVELFKKNDRIIYDNAGDNLDSLVAADVRLNRPLYFSSYGYTDNTGATEVTDEIIARYNRALKLSDKKILREAYSVVSYGSFTIKYATSNNIPDFTSEPEYPLVVE